MIFLIAFFSICFGFALAFFATRQKIPGTLSLVPPEEAALKEPEGLPTIGYPELKKLALQLAEKNQLTLKEEQTHSERERVWILESKNGFFYGQYAIGFILVSPVKPYVSIQEVIEFKDFVKSVGGARAHLFTNGYFTRDVYQVLEGPKVALYNKQHVAKALVDPNLLVSSAVL